MSNQPIAVLGGGNVGHTIAADLTLAGYKVNFYEHPQFEETFKTTLEKGVVEIEDEKTGRHERARIHNVTTDMKEAISDVRLILVALPSFGQELFFNTMIPYLKDGQVVFVMTGNFGSLRLRKLLSEKVPNLKITIYETCTMPYGTRLVGPARVSVHWGVGPWIGTQSMAGLPKRVRPVCALPAKDTNVALEEFQKLYPLFSPAKNVLISVLNNANFVIHPAPSMLSAGRIEYANLYLKCDFRLHREAHTPSVRRIEDGIADEMAALIRTLGDNVAITKTWVKEWSDYQQTVPIEHVSLGPRTLRDRYITEDIPYGLVPMSELGEKLGVATPLINAFIEIASVLNQEDYRKTGRTLEYLGLAELSKEQIVKLVEEGI